MYKIYTLTCPLLNEVVYVGKTKSTLEKRLIGHLCDKSNARKRDWVLKLRSHKLKPKIDLVQVCEAKDADFAENNLINYYARAGVALLNGKSSDGFKMKQVTMQLDESVLLAVVEESVRTNESKQSIINKRLKQSYNI